jgi:adenosylcobyric acid synthase
MKRTKNIMIQGTASSSGKSLITTALCRILSQDGFKVAPFKAQNISNNSYVTSEGLEMGRAQVVQALAAGIEPQARMNPVLVKPSGRMGAQVVLNGIPAFTFNSDDWKNSREELVGTISQSYESLVNEYEIIVIEGAGSPAEINLKKNDFVNMGMAKMADASVIIVGDIDRGGVFASLYGTFSLLDPDERVRVKGFIINKFRGDAESLQSGIDELERITGIPVLGIVPWIEHTIDDEDEESEMFRNKNVKYGDVDICIIRQPHISNFNDFIPLEMVPGVSVRWCDTKGQIGKPDLLILPGSKNTIGDLQSLKRSGIADAIIQYAKNGGTIFGVCGGFQMLGLKIDDPRHVESLTDSEEGLGLLDMTTEFYENKRTSQVSITINGQSTWLFKDADVISVNGYEIHMGYSTFGLKTVPFTYSNDLTQCGYAINGVTDRNGNILGTYLHGIFDKSTVMMSMVNALRQKKGLDKLSSNPSDRQSILESELDNLALICRKHLDMNSVYEILNAVTMQ